MSRRKKHASHEEEHENHERWLVSYADMITLLMVFFLVLYSSSQLNVSKYKAFQEAAAESLGAAVKPPPDPDKQGNSKDSPPDPTGKEPGSEPQPSPKPPTGESKDDPIQELFEHVKAEVRKAGLADKVDVQVDDRGVVLVFTDRVLFATAQADIVPAGRQGLDKLVPVLKTQPNPIVVEGHTDNVPITSARFPTNWELSTARATTVLRYLIETGGIPGVKVSAAGYADTHPRQKNDTAEHRAANRRVEIILVAPPEAQRAAPAVSRDSRGTVSPSPSAKPSS